MSEGIAYQNKDIQFKILSEGFKEKSFRAYGLELPRIKEVLPTNLPRVSADEKRIDNLFLLEDDTIAIVDYESEDKPINKIKYINYIARILERYNKDNQKVKDIRMIVIYTGDIQNAKTTFELTCLTLRTEAVFLSKLEGESIYCSIKQNIENKKALTEEELMQLIILPLTDKGNNNKRKRIKQVVELAKQLEPEQQSFVLSGVLVSTDKFIDKQYAANIRRWLSMTKVFQIFEEEKQAAIKQAVSETKKSTQLAEKREIATNLLLDGVDIIKIMQYTGLTKKQIEKIKG